MIDETRDIDQPTKRVGRRPPMQDTQVQEMLLRLVTDEEFYREAQPTFMPDDFAPIHQVYAALWAVTIGFRQTHGRLPLSIELMTEWEARLKVLSLHAFCEAELEILDEVLQRQYEAAAELAVARLRQDLPAVENGRQLIHIDLARQYLKWYREDQITLRIAADFDVTKFTPAAARELLQRYDTELAALDATADTPELQTISIGDLLAQDDVAQTWFVRDFLADPGQIGQTGNRLAVWAGPLKSLKTLTLCDLAVSVASGTDFLGQARFRVPSPLPVLLITAESGEANIKRHLRAVCDARGIASPSGLPLHLYFRAPQLQDPRWIDWLRRAIVRTGAAIVGLEPLYLSLLAAENTKLASDLHAMGGILNQLARLADETGVLIILGHHAGKAAVRERGNAPMELSDIHGAGLGEFASQWILINRRMPYDDANSEREHKLWLRFGGRQGHSGLLALDIREGPHAAPVWRTSVMTPSELKQQVATERVETLSVARQALHDQIVAIVYPSTEPLTRSAFRKKGVKGTQVTIDEALMELTNEGRIVTDSATIRGKICNVFRAPHTCELVASVNGNGQRRTPPRRAK